MSKRRSGITIVDRSGITEPVYINRCILHETLIAAVFERLANTSTRSMVDLRLPLGAEIEIQGSEMKLAPPSAWSVISKMVAVLDP